LTWDLFLRPAFLLVTDVPPGSDLADDSSL
jgi:hypothetical protein